MHKARAVFFVCAGLFLLALSYHLGARNAGAQQGTLVSGFTANGGFGYGPGGPADASVIVLTANGGTFARYMASATGVGGSLVYMGNFWSGGPTPAQQESWGAMKSRYRGERGAQPTTQDR